MSRIKRTHNYIYRTSFKDASYWFLLVFLTLPHMKTPYLAMIPATDMIFDILRGISFLIIVLWYVLERKSVSLVVVLVAVWRAVLIYSTVMHKGEIYRSIIESFSILSVVLLYDAAYNNRKPLFLSAQLFCFELFIYINLITELLYPKGLYINRGSAFVSQLNWFIGYYNNHSQYFVPALMIAWLYKINTGRKVRTLILTFVIYFSALLIMSGGVLLTLFCVFVVFVVFKRFTKVFNYYTYWSAQIIFFFTLTPKILDLYKWVLASILGKWMSLIARINVWEKTWNLISESWILGHGLVDSFTRSTELHVGWAATHAHNLILEQLYQGGIIGVALWVGIILVSGQKLIKYGFTMESKIISTAFLGWCVATLVEPFTTPFLIGMFVIAYRSNRVGSAVTDNDGLVLPVEPSACR